MSLSVPGGSSAVGALMVGAPLASRTTRTRPSVPPRTTKPSSAVRLNAIAIGVVLKSFWPTFSNWTPLFMLSVSPVSTRVVTLNTLSRPWTLTLNRNGPLGEAPTLGTYALAPLIAMPCSTFGNAPVANVKVGGSVAGMRSSTEPFELKPVLAIGLSTTVPRMVSVADEIVVTRPSLPSSRPSFWSIVRASGRSSARK